MRRDGQRYVGVFRAQALLGLILLSCAQPRELLLDEPFAGELAGGEARRFTSHLAAGDYVQVVVEQFGLDVAVSLDDPEGTERLRVDSPNGSVGPERLDFVAEITGRHQLQITAAEGVGRYEVRLEARRPATAQDREAGKAAKKFFEAEKFHLARHFEAAIDAYGEAIESWQLLGEGAQEAYTHFKVGLINQRQHRWASAIEAYSKVVELFRQLGGTDRLAPYVLNRLGTAYRETLALEDASKAHEEALRLAREFGEGREQASALNNLALIDRQQGRTRRAGAYYRRAIDLWQVLQDPVNEATSKRNLAYLYLKQGRSDQALSLMDQALALSRQAQSSAAEASTLYRYGVVQRARRDLSASRQLLERALELWPRTIEVGPVYRELGKTYTDLGDYAAAGRALDKALDSAIHAEDRRLEASVLLYRGWLADETGQAGQALASYREAGSLFRDFGSRSEVASALYGEARAESRRGAPETARPLLEEALVLIEDQRAEAVGRESRMAYLASKQDYYGLAIDSLAALHAEEPGAGFDRRAFEMSERRRVRALLDALADALEGLGDPTDSAQLMPGAVQSLDPRSLLDPQTVLLEFALGEERSFLWWVSQAGVEMFPLAGREVIEDLAQQASRLLQQSGERRARGQLELVLSQLSQLLLAPVADRLAGQRLVVVTDGALQTIPFAALPSPAADERQAELRTLLTDHEIVHLPSLSTLSLLRQRTQIRPSPPKRLAVVADPVFDRDPPTGEPLKRLAFSRQEAERILRLVPAEQTFAALGFDATKDLVTHGALADYGFLHFATHAFFDPREPETSGVLFTQVNRSGAVLDALLRPHEIYRLRLPVEMVVLSACRSGLGREIRGEGLIGPAQGFLYAGASRVVASSWAVEDEATAELMEAFYRGILIGGLRPAAALRAAQLAMITDDQKAAPYYWAGFVLQGDWR